MHQGMSEAVIGNWKVESVNSSVDDNSLSSTTRQRSTVINVHKIPYLPLISK